MASMNMSAWGVVTKQLVRYAALALGMLLSTQLWAVTVNVVDTNGNPVSGFRWVLEEDATYRQTPGTRINPGDANDGQVQSFNFYKSHMPVAGQGAAAGTSATFDVPDASKHYFVSILPNAGFGLSGRPVAVGQGSVTVVVHAQPTPTAQIFVLAFHDNNPINNAHDQPQEVGLGGLTVKIDDTLDQVKQDAFGNMLGTVYRRDANGNPIYDATGNLIVLCPGNGVIQTITQADINAARAGNVCRNPYGLQLGEALIKNLHPSKYGVQTVPPTGSLWQQTSTIEGSKTNDAWVKANEPPYFAEFGPGVWHVAHGYVQPFRAFPPATGATGSISGRIVNMHMSRPPEYTFWPGQALDNCWIGLNESLIGGRAGRGLYAAPCGAGAQFDILNVPAGTYQLVMWDKNLLNIIGYHTVVVPVGGAAVALGDVPVFRWFGISEHYVYNDTNGNGIRDIDLATGQLEVGIPEQAVILRYRDGSVYQSAPTDMDGYVPFEKVFPFFFWQVAEVDFLRFKATGLTVTVDAGGQVAPTFGDKLNPQIQAGGGTQRTELGPVLTQAFQQFLGTTNIFEWGKQAYGPGENGGVSGIVRYATTRGENDPRFAAAEDWEPGIPHVQVNLYLDQNRDGVIDDVNASGQVELADVDNFPFGWANGGARGAEDVDRNNNGVFDAGDAVNVVTTDSWDDNLPSGCPAGNAPNASADLFYQGGKCYDGIRNFNQVRPGVFDGGYAFNEYHPGGMASGSTPVALPAGMYIVEAPAPPLYTHQREEDKNVDFGDNYRPSPLLLPPVCVGAAHTVPNELLLFPGVASAYAGQSRPLCDRKQVQLASQQNGAADFYVFTEVPIAGHGTGLVLNDLGNEFDINSPNFSEKLGMPFMPISVRDWAGHEVNRVYTDQYGGYNLVVPSTFTANRPSPTGVSQAIYNLCINDPGPIPDPANPGQMITDPHYSRQYSQFCVQRNFLPGVVTFLDTPVLPVAAFAANGLNPVDSELPNGSPAIHSVSGPLGGPYVPTGALRRITITSMGTVNVANPAFSVAGNLPRTIPRDFGFGATPGTVRLGNTNLTIVAWTNDSITVDLPPAATTGQLSVTRSNGNATVVGVTVTVGTTTVMNVAPGGSIQAAIDAAPAGALILVPPGNYEQMVIVYKNVRLQGWGAGSTIINGTLGRPEQYVAWRQKMCNIIAANVVDLLPGQTCPLQAPGAFVGNEGAPIFVVARPAGQTATQHLRIDGFTVAGSQGSSGIVINSHTRFAEISNNRVLNNQGIYGGGIRLGHPLLAVAVAAQNNNARIHHNQVCENGTLEAPGGGIALYRGSNAYVVSDNWVCANFAQNDGGGIAHYGLSQDGRIINNKILFNQTFVQTVASGGAGGGVFVGGVAPIVPAAPGAVPPPSAGSGSVTIEANLIQGNNAGSGDGAGIAALRVNGADVNNFRTNPLRWYRLDVFDNIIVNNVAGSAGGGIALQDALRTRILHNTVAHNDSTATTIDAFQTNTAVCTATANQSCPQPAGVVTRNNTGSLQRILNLTGRNCGFALFPREYCAFSNPLLANNIVWQNRSFYYTQTPSTGVPGSQPVGRLLPDVAGGAAPVFSDLAVLGVAGQLGPRNSVLTSTTGYHVSNTAGDPAFVAPYFNGDRGRTIIQPEFTTNLTVAAALDEGGNFIDVHYGPLVLSGNYHLQRPSSAAERGALIYYAVGLPATLTDVDGELRPVCGLPDAGADEIAGVCTTLAGAAATVANTPIVIGLGTVTAGANAANGGQALSAVAVRTPTTSGATVAINPDRSGMTYTPATNWTGTDTVLAVVSDANGLHTSSTTVTVAAAPAAPSAPDDGGASAPVDAPVAGNDTPVSAGQSGGSASVTAAAATAALPTAMATSADTGTQPIQVAKATPSEQIDEAVNNLPLANNDELVLRDFDAKRGLYVFAGPDILDNDTDDDGDRLTAVLETNVQQGSVQLAADGSFTYTPPKGAAPKGPLSFTYRARDGRLTSEAATVTFTVEPNGKAAPAAKTESKKVEPQAQRAAPASTAAPVAVVKAGQP